MTVPIRLSDTTGEGVLGVETSVTYDGSVVTVLDTLVTSGSLTESGWFAASNIVPGIGGIDTLKIGLANPQDPLAGSGPLVFIRLLAGGAQLPDTTALGLARVLFNEGTPAAGVQGGSVVVIEPEEYGVDTSTVALYHFNTDLNDAGPNGLHLNIEGNAQRVSDNLGWMQIPGGKVLRTQDLGDQVTVSFSETLLTAPISIEARIFPRAYKAYSVADGPIVSLRQDWNTRLQLNDRTWSTPTGPRVEAGAGVVLVNEADWEANVALDAWHLLRMTFDLNGEAEVHVDGVLLAAETIAMTVGSQNWVFTLGNFDGDIDEVRISDVVRTGGATKRAWVAGRDAAAAPLTFSMDQNYPNPFNLSTNIRYSLPETDDVRLTIHNILGQRVRVLVNAVQTPGTYQVVWDGRNRFGQTLATGVFFSRLEAGPNSTVRKMFIIK